MYWFSVVLILDIQLSLLQCVAKDSDYKIDIFWKILDERKEMEWEEMKIKEKGGTRKQQPKTKIPQNKMEK